MCPNWRLFIKIISVVRRTHHSHRIAGDDGLHVHDDVVGDVGQDVDHRDDGHGNGDGQGQIPERATVKKRGFDSRLVSGDTVNSLTLSI